LTFIVEQQGRRRITLDRKYHVAVDHSKRSATEAVQLLANELWAERAGALPYEELVELCLSLAMARYHEWKHEMSIADWYVWRTE
jgi:hypothetical protein